MTSCMIYIWGQGRIPFPELPGSKSYVGPAIEKIEDCRLKIVLTL